MTAEELLRLLHHKCGGEWRGHCDQVLNLKRRFGNLVPPTFEEWLKLELSRLDSIEH